MVVTVDTRDWFKVPKRAVIVLCFTANITQSTRTGNISGSQSLALSYSNRNPLGYRIRTR